MKSAVLLLALAAAPASAQIPYTPTFTTPGERFFSLHLGLAQPTGTSGLSSVAGKGPSVGIEYFSFLNDWFALGAAIDMHVLGTGADAGPPARTGSAGYKGLSVLGRVNFLRELSWTPYVVGGAGYGLGDVSVSCAGPGCGTAASTAKSALGPSVTLGVGLDSFLSPAVSWGAEARVSQFKLPAAAVTFPAPSRTGQALAFRLFLRYWLGPKT